MQKFLEGFSSRILVLLAIVLVEQLQSIFQRLGSSKFRCLPASTVSHQVPTTDFLCLSFQPFPNTCQPGFSVPVLAMHPPAIYPFLSKKKSRRHLHVSSLAHFNLENSSSVAGKFALMLQLYSINTEMSVGNTFAEVTALSRY